jgi:hypothetical protein
MTPGALPTRIPTEVCAGWQRKGHKCDFAIGASCPGSADFTHAACADWARGFRKGRVRCRRGGAKLARTIVLGTEKEPSAFVAAECFNDVIPAVIALAAVHDPPGKCTTEDRVGLAVRNVLLRPSHGDLICSILSDLAIIVRNSM